MGQAGRELLTAVIARWRQIQAWWSRQTTWGRRFYATLALIYLFGTLCYCLGIASLVLIPLPVSPRTQARGEQIPAPAPVLTPEPTDEPAGPAPEVPVAVPTAAPAPTAMPLPTGTPVRSPTTVPGQTPTATPTRRPALTPTPAPRTHTPAASPTQARTPAR